jgi:MFS family permease
VAYRAPAQVLQSMSVRTLAQGFGFVFQHKILLTVMALDLFAVLLGGATALLPIFAKDLLQVGPRGLGYMQAAPAIGALLTSIILAHRKPLARAGRAMLCAVAGFGVATIVFGWSHSFELSLAMLFVTGACDMISVVVRQTLVQLLTPDEMRGRVSAVSGMFIGASNELGGYESGMVANWLGPRTSVILGGYGTLLVVGVAAFFSPGLRRYGSLTGFAGKATPQSLPQPPIAAAAVRMPQPSGRETAPATNNA